MATRDLKAFMSDVKKVVRNEGTLREKYQELAIEAMERYQENGNSEYMAGLVNEMGLKSRYRESMINYFKAHAPVQTEKNPNNTATPAGDNAIKFKTRNGCKPADTNLDAARETSFQDAKRGGGRERAGEVVFDEADQLSKFLERHKKMANGDLPKRYNDADLLPEESINLIRRAFSIAQRGKLEQQLREITGETGEQAQVH